MIAPARPRERARRRRGFSPGLWALRLLVLAAVFALGVGLGRTLDEGEIDDAARTSVRTLKPLEVPPARETVTVTVTVSG